MISSRQIASAVSILLKEGKYSHDEVSDKFVNFIKKHHLESQVPKVLTYLKNQSEKESREKTLLIQTPSEIDGSTEKAISDYISVADGTPVKKVINKNIIGGFKAYYKDKKFDGSVENTLQRLREKLLA